MKKNYKLSIMIVILLIIIMVNGFIFYKAFFNSTLFLNTNKNNVELSTNLKLISILINNLQNRKPLESYLPTSSPSGQISQNTKNEPFIMKIYNAGGIPDMAANLKNSFQLFNLFSQINIENASSTSASVLKVKKIVNTETLGIIRKELSKVIPQYEEIPLDDKNPEDIILIIGSK